MSSSAIRDYQILVYIQKYLAKRAFLVVRTFNISGTVLRYRVIDRSRDDRRKKGSAENSAVTPTYEREGGSSILFFSTFYFEEGGIPHEDRMGVRGNFTKRDIASYSVLNRRILRTTLFLPGTR